MQAYVDQIERIHHQLRETDLAPGPEVNALFSELVGIAITAPARLAPAVLTELDSSLDDLRRLCSEGETLLEIEWSTRIAAAEDPWAELERFPYTDNYRRLTALELGALTCAGGHAEHVTVIGSGPLPLTAVMLAHEHGLRVTTIEIDRHREHLGARLVAALGLDHLVTSRVGDATDPALGLTGTDAVILAALVGAGPRDKQTATAAVASTMRDGAHLIVRTSAGMRSLLYLPVEPAELAASLPGLRPLVEVHPHDDVVNSVVVLRRERD